MTVTSIQSHAHRQHGYRNLSFLLLGMCCSVPFAMSVGDLSMASAMLWAAMTASICFPAWRYRHLANDAFHPYSYFTLLAFTTFVFPALLFKSDHLLGGTENDYNKAVVLVAGSSFFTALGFLAPIGGRLGWKLPTLTFGDSHLGRTPTFVPTAIVIYLLGWVARLGRASAGYSHGETNIDASVETLGLFADLLTLSTLAFIVILASLLSRRQRPSTVLLVFGLVLLEVAGGLLVGSRSGAFVPVLVAAFAFSCTGRRINLWWLVAAYIAALLIVAPLMTAYRSAYKRERFKGNPVSFGTVVRAAQGVDEQLARQGGLSAVRSQTIAQQGNGFESLIRVVEIVPSERSYEWGSSIISNIGTLVIPRFLWPSKPSYDVGVQQNIDFWGARVGSHTSISIGLSGDAFLNFGWSGLPAFLLLGMGLRTATTWAASYERSSVLELVWKAFIVFVLVNVGRDLAGFTVFVVRSAALHVLFLILLHRRLPTVRSMGRRTETRRSLVPVESSCAIS